MCAIKLHQDHIEIIWKKVKLFYDPIQGFSRIQVSCSLESRREFSISHQVLSFISPNKAVESLLELVRFRDVIPVRFFGIWGPDPQLLYCCGCRTLTVIRSANFTIGVQNISLRFHDTVAWETSKSMSTFNSFSLLAWKGLCLNVNKDKVIPNYECSN